MTRLKCRDIEGLIFDNEGEALAKAAAKATYPKGDSLEVGSIVFARCQKPTTWRLVKKAFARARWEVFVFFNSRITEPHRSRIPTPIRSALRFLAKGYWS